MKFVRKKGYHLKTKPQIVGEVCQGLEKDGKLTAKNLVDVSRDINAPLHKEFEWRDGIAAEKYREVQAGYIIRSVAIKISEMPSEVTRMELNLTTESKETDVRFFHAVDLDGKGFDSLDTISGDEKKTEKLLEICMKDIKSFKEKYYILRSLLPDLFSAIDETLEQQRKE